jgi:N utilization substance protein A
MEVIVEDKQLSLAIGKKGQNVRLAAKLTGWKIDIKSEEEKRREVEAQLGALEIGEPGADEAPAGEQPSSESQGEPAVSAETAEAEKDGPLTARELVESEAPAAEAALAGGETPVPADNAGLAEPATADPGPADPGATDPDRTT